MEPRALLNATAVYDHIVSHPIVVAGSVANPASISTPDSPPYTPAEIGAAYGISSKGASSIILKGLAGYPSGLAGTGSGQTIAIIDADNDPNIVGDLTTFNTEFSLPQFNGSSGPTFTVLNESGGTTLPTAVDSSGGWEVEESLDVEWAHAIAPQANIILFEANSDSDSDLMTAVKTAAAYSGVSVVSMSWSGPEDSSETSYDSYFTTPANHVNVTFLASTGDSGAPGGYPAFSPNVVAVGGTTLNYNSSTSTWSETAWSDGGGGPSVYESEPSYQESVQTSGVRETPDVSFDANPSTGVEVYDSYDEGGWLAIGGTSVACPCWAGLIAIADQFRAAEKVGLLNGPAALYALSNPYTYNDGNGYFNDITSGSNGYAAGPGYDMATGIGSPIADVLIPALAPVPAPDLSVSVTDSGSGVFHPGDVGDAYTITVSNTGVTATSGAVSLVDALPAGLTATAMSGSGWTVDPSTLTATRSDSLAAGASYPALTLTVNVAAGASGSATDTATVSGGGAANAAGSDTVTIAPPADLTVGITDSGNFKQGDAADTYTITVSNSGAGPTAGAVSLVDALPAGLTAAAMSGSGWTVNLSTLTATRSDALAAGASYAALTLTVSVAENAPTSITNTATVSGGGETNTANDTASDTTSVAVVVPAVAGTNPSLTGGTLAAGAAALTITFNEAMTGGGTAANYQLCSVGPDGLFSDDVVVPLTVSYSGDAAVLTFSGLTQSIYRLTVYDTITNTAGVALAGNWVTDFVVVPSGALLGSATTTAVGADPLAVATGDFTNNGELDLAVVSYVQYHSHRSGYYAAGTVQILLNNGNGTFTAGNSYSTDAGFYSDAAPYAMAVGDFTGNGDLDLAVASYDQYYGSGTVEIFLGNGNGAFTAGNEYQGTGNGTGFNPISIAAADFNDNGNLDLAVANYSNNQVDVLTGNGNGAFSTTFAAYSTGTEPRAVAVADFNGDGLPDLAVANYGSNTVSVLLNTSSENGGITFANAVNYSTGGVGPRSLAVGDFNGETPDLVVGNYSSGTVGILLNNGNGTFAAAATYSSGGTDPRGVAVADFNDDGYPDVVVANNGSNTIAVLLNNGNGTFAAATAFSTGSGSGPFGVTVGDFTGDGMPDVAVTNASSNAVAVLLNASGPSSGPLTVNALTPPTATESAAFSDALLFHFSDANSSATAADYSALITWGDGSFSAVAGAASAGGQIVADPGGGFDVLGSHLYAQQLSGATFTVQVTDGQSYVAASESNFSVADEPLLATGGVGLSFGQNLTIAPQTVVAAFTDPGGAQALGNYSASINWGDGTAASEGVLSLANGVFTVAGGHTYTTLTSPYAVVVGIVHNAMAAVTAIDSAGIAGTVTATANQTASSLSLANGAAVVVAAGATLTVTNNVTLSSGAVIDVQNGGTLVLSSLVQGSGAAGLTLAGTLEAAAAFSTTVPIAIAAGGGTVNTNGFDVVLAGGLSGGALTVTGGGALTISDSDTYTGGTTISGGTLTIASAAALPSSGLVTIGGGGRLVLGSGSGIGAPLAASSPADSGDATTSIAAAAAGNAPIGGEIAAPVVAAPTAPRRRPARPLRTALSLSSHGRRRWSPSLPASRPRRRRPSASPRLPELSCRRRPCQNQRLGSPYFPCPQRQPLR